MKLMKMSPIVLVGLAAAAYFLFFRKSTPTAPAAIPSSAGPTATAAKPDPLASVISAGAGLVTAGVQYGAGKAVEALSGDGGMAPASLSGHMASVGALGDLNGTFYGGW